MRQWLLKRYGIEAELAPMFPDPAKREAVIHQLAETWAKVFDPLAQACSHYDVQKDFVKVRARVLYVLSRTTKLFPLEHRARNGETKGGQRRCDLDRQRQSPPCERRRLTEMGAGADELSQQARMIELGLLDFPRTELHWLIFFFVALFSSCP